MKQKENTFFLGFTRFLSFRLLERCMVTVTNDNSAGRSHFGFCTGDVLNCIQTKMSFNSEPKDKISDLYQFKVLADDKIRVTRTLKFVVERLENIVGKRENAERQHFFLFPLCFQNGHYDSRVVISRDCVVKC